MISTKLQTAFLTVATLAIMGLFACDNPDCNTEGCPDNQVCDNATGQCSNPTLSCVEVGCPDGQFCDIQTELCLERGTFCQPPGATDCGDQICTTCPEGSVCDALSGLCVGQFDCGVRECPAAQRCNLDTLACEDVPCTDDIECPTGSVCQGELCQVGCRTDRDCRSGESCEEVGEDDLGSCQTSCTEDETCPWGEICVLQGSGRSSCQPEPPCDVDSECREGESCRRGTCARELCSEDEDCSEGEYCFRDTGACLSDACQADQFEPNDRIDTATALLLGGYDGLTLCRGEEDWFSIQTDGQEPLNISIVHDRDVDLDLEAYANDRLIASSGSGSTTETVLVPAEGSREVNIRVLSLKGRDVRYFMLIRIPPLTCEEDDFEPNDTPGTATPLMLGAQFDMTTCAGDTDMLRIVPEGGPMTVLAESAPETPGQWLMRFGVGEGASGPLSAVEDGTFETSLAHVSRTASPLLTSLTSHERQWSVIATSQGPLCADPTDNNRGPGDNAEPLALIPETPLVTEERILCASVGDGPTGLEADWYRLDGLPEGAVEIEVGLTQTTPTNQWGERVALRGILASGAEALPWRAASAGPEGHEAAFIARVSRVDRPLWLSVDAPSELPDILQDWPRYTQRINARPLEGCVQDRSEGAGNNTQNTATALTGPLTALLCPSDTDILALDLDGSTPDLTFRSTEAAVRVQITTDLGPEAVFVGVVDAETGVLRAEGLMIPEGASRLFIALDAESVPGEGAIYSVSLEP